MLADVKTGYKRAGGASLYLRQVLPLQLTRLVVSGIQVYVFCCMAIISKVIFDTETGNTPAVHIHSKSKFMSGFKNCMSCTLLCSFILWMADGRWHKKSNFLVSGSEQL